MSIPSGKRPLIQMIVKLTEQYFGRIHEGKMHYPKDAQTLRDYAKAALKLEEPITAGSVLLTEGLAHIYAGKLDAALNVYKQAYALFENEYDFLHIAACTNNVANVYEIRGELDLALVSYRKGLEMVAWMPNDYATKSSILTREAILQVLKTNEALILLALGHYSEAKVCFEEALNYFDGQTISNLEAMFEIRRGLAEVYLAEGEYKAGLSSLRLADELDSDVNNNLLGAGLFFTHAHFAEKVPNYGTTPSQYYNLVERIMSDLQTPIVYARVLLDEARYQKLNNNLAASQEFAQKAYRLFKELEIEEECQLAAALMENEKTS